MMLGMLLGDAGHGDPNFSLQRCPVLYVEAWGNMRLRTETKSRSVIDARFRGHVVGYRLHCTGDMVTVHE